MDAVWQVIEPWVAALGGVTGASTVIYAIVRLILGRVIKKNNAMLNENYNADKISQAVADRLAGKTMNIDVTAVTEKALKKLTNELNIRVEDIEEAVGTFKCILIAIAKGIVKLKALTDEERAELASAIAQLEKDYKAPEKEVPLTVLLQPVEIPKTETNDDHDDTEGGVNFGGLEG